MNWSNFNIINGEPKEPGGLWNWEWDRWPLLDYKAKPRELKNLTWTVRITNERTMTGTGADTCRILSDRQLTEAVHPRFKTTTKRSEEEEDKREEEDVFDIQMEEEQGETAETTLETGTGRIEATMIAEGEEALLEGLLEAIVEGGVLGATEGGWERIGAGAFERAAELDVTANVTGNVAGSVFLLPERDKISGTLDLGPATIRAIPVTMKPRNGKMRWRMRDRYTCDVGIISHTEGIPEWIRGKRAQLTQTRWLIEPPIDGIFLL
jgi:hypothetical protein